MSEFWSSCDLANATTVSVAGGVSTHERVIEYGLEYLTFPEISVEFFCSCS